MAAGAARPVERYVRLANAAVARAVIKTGFREGVARDAARMVELYTRSADAGDADAMFNLGLCYQRGEGVEKDAAKAVELYSRAADAGSAVAMLSLGVCHDHGEGVDRVAAKAVERTCAGRTPCWCHVQSRHLLPARRGGGEGHGQGGGAVLTRR
jgi:TPR repeat protein